MGQDGDTYLGYRIESRDIDIVGHIKERDKIAIQELRRNLNRILNPQYSATLTYELGDFKRVIGCTINNAPIFKRGARIQPQGDLSRLHRATALLKSVLAQRKQGAGRYSNVDRRL